MRIELELPDWIAERRLTILAGVELVATKVPWEDFWKVKKTRCNRCGQCCMSFKPNSNVTPYGVDDEGKCKALVKEPGEIWTCSVGTQRPYDCLFDPIDESECCIEYDIVKSK